MCPYILIKCLPPYVMSVSPLQYWYNRFAWTCPVSFNPDWLMQSLLCVQNKSRQFLKALSFLQSLAKKQFVRVRLFEKTFIHFFIAMVFVRGVREFQALLDACSSTREWETFYLTLNIGCLNKTHTHIHRQWSRKLSISILSDYYKTVASYLSGENEGSYTSSQTHRCIQISSALQ